jgi:hypothetical protein
MYVAFGRRGVRAIMNDTILSSASVKVGLIYHIKTEGQNTLHWKVRSTYYRLSNVGMELGVINWEVRGYLSEIHLKN